MPGLLDLLSDEDRRRVWAGMRRRRFSSGQTIFHEGDLGDTLHVIDRGHVAVRVATDRGDVATLAVLGRGQTFGELALLGPGSRRSASAICIDDVETLSMEAARYDELRASHPEVARFVVQALAEQIRLTTERLVEALYVPAEQRVLRRVAELGLLYAKGDGPVEVRVTQDDIATMAGTTRSTANRVLKAAEADGLVALSRGSIEVTDRAALARRVR